MENATMMNLLMVAVTIESVAEIFMGIRGNDGKPNWKLILSIVIGVVAALLMPSFDAFHALGIVVVPPIAGRILTGIMASRGAKLFHDFLGIVESYKNNLKAGTGN